MNEAVWKVYWNEYVSDTYLYGSEIYSVSYTHLDVYKRQVRVRLHLK